MSASPAALLTRARELARGRLAPPLDAALTALPKEMRAAVEASAAAAATAAAATTARAEQALLEEAAAAAEAKRDPIVRAFEAGLLAVFDGKLRPAASAASAGPTELGALTLVDDEAMELEIALGRLVRKTASELDANELAGIGARLGELAVGKSLEGPGNPLGPETALEALKRGCEVASQSGPVRMALVNSLQPHLAAALRKLHVELNEMLIAEGVLPRIRRSVQRPAGSAGGARPGGAAGGSGGQGAPAQAAGDAARMPGLPPGMTMSQALALKDLLPSVAGAPLDVRAVVGALLEAPATSRRYGARMLANPEGSLYAQAMTMPVPQSVLAQLAQVQHAGVAGASGGAGVMGGAAGVDDLNAVVAELARGGEHPLEQLTGELVAVVFDFLLHDRDLPEPVKAELARLQIVAFKAALLDRTFFAKREHPLRELLTAVADSAADPEIDTAPDGRFVAGLHGIVDQVIAEFAEDLAVFVAARERLAALVQGLREEGEQAAAPVTAELVEQERDEVLRARAGVEVAKRMAAGAPPFVQRFLSDTWTYVLADAERHARAGDESWDARLALVDDLVWSVSPKQVAEVPRLTAMLPKLVPALNRGMKAVGVDAGAQRAFLDELMQLHTALLQAARAKRPLPPPPAAPPPPDDRIAAPELAPGAPPVLERGAVVEFADPDGAVRAKLSWISPQQTIYLFTARGAKARRVAPAELSAGLRQGRVRLVEAGGAVVDRALAAVVGEPAG